MKISPKGLRQALELRRRLPGDQISEGTDPGEHDWIRPALGFDAAKLDLDLAVVTFPGSARPAHLLDVLRSTERVVRLYRGYERDLIAVIVYDGARERQRLQTLLEEHEPELRWTAIRDVDDSAAAATWLSLAHRVAAQENLRG